MRKPFRVALRPECDPDSLDTEFPIAAYAHLTRMLGHKACSFAGSGARVGEVARVRGMTEVASRARIRPKAISKALSPESPRDSIAVSRISAAPGRRGVAQRREPWVNFSRLARPALPAYPAPRSQSDSSRIFAARLVSSPSPRRFPAPGAALSFGHRRAASTVSELGTAPVPQDQPVHRAFSGPVCFPPSLPFSISTVLDFNTPNSTPRTGTIQFPPGLQKSEASL